MWIARALLNRFEERGGRNIAVQKKHLLALVCEIIGQRRIKTN